MAIGAVFNASVREGWRFLDGLADEPMFPDAAWAELVADHAPPNVLLVALIEAVGVIGYCAVHPGDGEMYLLFVHPDWAGRGVAAGSWRQGTMLCAPPPAPGRSCSPIGGTRERSPSTRQPATALTDRFASPTFAARLSREVRLVATLDP